MDPNAGARAPAILRMKAPTIIFICDIVPTLPAAAQDSLSGRWSTFTGGIRTHRAHPHFPGLTRRRKIRIAGPVLF